MEAICSLQNWIATVLPLFGRVFQHLGGLYGHIGRAHIEHAHIHAEVHIHLEQRAPEAKSEVRIEGIPVHSDIDIADLVRGEFKIAKAIAIAIVSK